MQQDRHDDADALAWAQLLLAVLDEGRRTATYKLATMLALIDSCLLGGDAQGRPPQVIPVRDLAHRVLELYWPQVREYPRRDGGHLLSQSRQERAVTVDAVRRLRDKAYAAHARTPAAAQQLLKQDFEHTIDEIELNLVQMPLGKLQRPQGYSRSGAADYPRFLYEDGAFHEGVTARQLRVEPLSVHLQSGVPDWIVSLSGLLRPLVEMHWARAVAAFSGEALEEEGLRQFLFGSDRIQLTALRPGLLEAQSGVCFYCGRPLSSGAIQVDHFIPWSRVPNNGLANLVLADAPCNIGKRDHFAELQLLERWAQRPDDVLDQVGQPLAWPLRAAESKRVARSLYTHLPTGTQLWEAPGIFRLLDPARLQDILPLLDA